MIKSRRSKYIHGYMKNDKKNNDQQSISATPEGYANIGGMINQWEWRYQNTQFMFVSYRFVIYSCRSIPPNELEKRKYVLFLLFPLPNILKMLSKRIANFR